MDRQRRPLVFQKHAGEHARLVRQRGAEVHGDAVDALDVGLDQRIERGGAGLPPLHAVVARIRDLRDAHDPARRSGVAAGQSDDGGIARERRERALDCGADGGLLGRGRDGRDGAVDVDEEAQGPVAGQPSHRIQVLQQVGRRAHGAAWPGGGGGAGSS